MCVWHVDDANGERIEIGIWFILQRQYKYSSYYYLLQWPLSGGISV